MNAFETLTRYAPTNASVSAEWPADRRDAVLSKILGFSQAAGERPTEKLPLGSRRTHARRWSKSLPLAVSAALVAAFAIGIGAAVLSGRSAYSPAGRGGGSFTVPAGLPATSIAAGQYSYRVVKEFEHYNPRQTVVQNKPLVDRSWISPNGDIVSVRTGSQHGCMSFPRSGKPSFEQPTQAFFASLPTDVDALSKYLRNHVQGSSSRDEAIFVAVGDALRTADGLASPRLRAAMVAVLARTPGVTLHSGQRDYLGRPALRLDFVNQAIRPGEVQSLYFDPSTYQLLEERDGSNGEPHTYSGPSPAYTAPAPSGHDPQKLTSPAFVSVMKTERVVDTLPKQARC